MLSPIILFVYNRPWHTQQTVEALQKNELASESVLYVFADGEKPNATDEQKENIAKVRNYIHTISGFKEVHIEEATQNKGLANSVISGVSKVIEEYGKVIVVEDDIVTHPFFLRFMNDALNFYMYDKRIYSIGGFNYGIDIPANYNYDVYIVHRSESHGWGTWKNRWFDVDWDIIDSDKFFSSKRKLKKFNRGGKDMSNMLKLQLNSKIDSWAIRWDYHLYKHNAFCLRPIKSLVKNIGFDGSGVHCGSKCKEDYSACQYNIKDYNIQMVKNIKQNRYVAFNFFNFWGVESSQHFTLLKRIVKKGLRIVHIIK